MLFARILGADGYGSLAALVSTFLILAVPGSALQVAVARETALGRLGGGAQLAATLARWRRMLLVACVAVSAVAVLLREQIAALLSVDEVWAAAATLPTGVPVAAAVGRARRAPGPARATGRSAGRCCWRRPGGS